MKRRLPLFLHVRALECKRRLDAVESSGRMAETPIPIALMIADDVYQDARTGKWVIAGVFSRITASKVPTAHDKMVVFAQVTGVSSPVDLTFRIEHADSGTPIFQTGGPISAKSPLDVISLQIVLRKTPFVREGKYWIQLLSDEEILIQAPFQVNISEQLESDKIAENEQQ